MKPIAICNLSAVIKKLLFASILLTIPYVHAFCQEKIRVVKLSPQHFIRSTLKIDFERATGTHSSIIFSPSMAGFDSGNERVIGGGLELAKRIYVLNSEEYSLSGFYANVGATYNFYDIWYEVLSKHEVYTYPYKDSTTSQEFKEQIHQFGGDFVFGYQKCIKEVFYVDMFFGGGVRIGISTRGSDSNYRSFILDYGYNGFIPKVGIRAGLKIR